MPLFEEYIKYTRNLEYEQEPNYNYLRSLFLSVLKIYNWEFDYYYDWDQVGLTKSEIRDKENNNKSNKSKLSNSGHPQLYDKIAQLINERKNTNGIFDVDRFVFNIEEESNFNLPKVRSQNNETEPEGENYNYTNSMAPYACPRKRVKHQSGCLSCQPKGYKDTDNSCCVIYWIWELIYKLFFIYIFL